MPQDPHGIPDPARTAPPVAMPGAAGDPSTGSAAASGRVRVTSSRRGAGHVELTAMSHEIDAQTTLGDVYVAGLMRAQLRLAASVGLVALVGIAGFPLLLMLVPAARTLTIGGIPFPWLVLGLLVYPVVWALARHYDRQAARIEAEFITEVEGGAP